MIFRPSRGTPGHKTGRRFALVLALGCGVVAVGAPVASAHSALATLNDCSSVTFSYINFPATGTDKATEKITINGVTTTTVATWSNSSTHSDTVDFNGTGDNGKTITTNEVMTSSADGFVGNGPKQTFTLSGCALPLVYTGDAYNLELFGLLPLGPINQVGPVSTTAATNPPPSIILNESIPALVSLVGAQLESNVVTGSGSSTATTSVNSLSLNPLGIAAISTGEIQSSSQTTCSAGAITTSGSTTIASLTIAGMNITIPSPLPANTSIGIPGVGTVTLNEQAPVIVGGKKVGLTVNAIDINITLLGLVHEQIIIGHAESDVEGC